jgi:hypothetical protein
MTQIEVPFCDECYADLIQGVEHICEPDREVLKGVNND